MKQRKFGRASPVLPDHQGSQSRDRRHSPRIILRRTITYEVPSLPPPPHLLSGTPSKGILVNISNGGICFQTRRRLQRNMVLKVSLPMNKATAVVPTLAEVLRVKRDPRYQGYYTGLRFIL